MNLINSLNWRYATKRMTGDNINDEDLDNILEATRLSASSLGLQPYNIIVVSNPDIKAKLREVGYNQPQITESSHMLIFCVWEKITAGLIDEHIANVAATRGMPAAALDGLAKMIRDKADSLTAEEQQQWSARQVYIALGTALAAAAELEIDAAPMEGFIPEKFDEILGLHKKGLRSVVIMALGYRSKEDKMSGVKKVRRPKGSLFSFID